MVNLPALNFAEGLDLRDGYEDHDCLATTLDLNLTGGTDLKRTEFGVEVWDIGLQVEDSLGYQKLGLIRGGARGLSFEGELAIRQR